MNALTIVHETIRKFVGAGDVVIDATAGRGYDTSFLCSLVGDSGKVISFDVQKDAVDSTENLLKSRGQTADVHLESHENMTKYADRDSVSCIVFNLGYLPSGDHSVFTHAESTIKAIEGGLGLLKKGGLMCVSVYYGGDSGYEERDALLPYLKTLDSSKYQVLKLDFYNWTNDPPLPVFIIKN